jgi:hypothetical protein
MFIEIKKVIKFAPTVLATPRSERAAYQGESFAFKGFSNLTKTLPTLLLLLYKPKFGGILFKKKCTYDLR